MESHLFVLFDAAKLSSHNAIKHFIKVNMTVINLNAHLQDDTLYVQEASAVLDVHLDAHAPWQTLDETANVLHLEARELVPLSIVAPSLLKVVKVLLETGKRIIIFDVVLAELLNNHEDEKVQHDVSHDQDER